MRLRCDESNTVAKVEAAGWASVQLPGGARIRTSAMAASIPSVGDATAILENSPEPPLA